MRALIHAGLVAAAAIATAFAPVNVQAAGNGAALPKHHWSYQGLFGTFDRGELQRGYQVFAEVCATCHSLKYVHYRNLTEIGFTKDQVKKIAADVEVQDGPNDEGEMFDRAGIPGDRFVSPFPNDKAAAAANNGAVPPDLSLMTKARLAGPDHLKNILVLYPPTPPIEKNACRSEVEEKQPDGSMKMVMVAPPVPDGKYYNPAFPGCVISMPPPLSVDGVEYADGTKATIDQMAHDVTVFLAWAAEPELEKRKNMGWKVILFLIFVTGLLYALKRKIWGDVH